MVQGIPSCTDALNIQMFVEKTPDMFDLFYLQKTLEVVQGIPTPDALNIQIFVEKPPDMFDLFYLQKTLEVVQGIPTPDALNIQMFVEKTGFAHQVIITVTQPDGQKQQVWM